jgi:hypothetical protein
MASATMTSPILGGYFGSFLFIVAVVCDHGDHIHEKIFVKLDT